MARFPKYIYVLILFLLPVVGKAGSGYFSFMNITVQVADSTAAAAFITEEDSYTRSFSTFDLQGRFRDNKTHTSKEYVAFAGKQMRTWSPDEHEVIKSGFKAIEDFLRKNNLDIKLPDTILFIKSTCEEEFGAGGYTRNNGIVIKLSEPATTALIAHELFHVLTRHNPKLRDRLYDNIGFKRCNNIDVNKVMGGLNITNPDCPVISHYVTIGGEDMTLLLHSRKPYAGGDVLGADYLSISLLALEGNNDNKAPKIKDDRPVLYKLDERPELFNIVGTNTDYVLHPEEICAEHFAALVTERVVDEPVYIEKMKTTLSR